jgi:hypothetical protein
MTKPDDDKPLSGSLSVENEQTDRHHKSLPTLPTADV